MIHRIKHIYQNISSIDITKLLYTSIFIVLAGFLLNGVIFKLSQNISQELYNIADKLLFILEGSVIAVTLLFLLIKRPKRIICIYAVLGLIFLISYLIFPQNKEAIITIVCDFFLYCVTSLILFWEVSEDRNVYKKLVKITKITFVCAIFYLILLIINNEKIYNLWLSRFFFFSAIFNLYDAFKNKNKASIAISILSFITIFSTGSRTYLILYGLSAILLIIMTTIKIIANLDKKKKMIAISIIICTLLIICIFLINYKQICNNLYDFFSDKGIHVRVLRLLSTGNFFTSNDRINIIYPTIIRLIGENWFMGLGVGGDRTALYNLYEQAGTVREDGGINSYYAHNIILEIYASFGIIIGTLLIIFIILSYYKVLKNKINIDLLICFTFIAIIPAMLTGTLWDNVYFWALIGIFCANYDKHFKKNFKDKVEKEKIEYDKNIVMLLDNGFDPDVRVYKEARYLLEQNKNVEIVCLDKKNKYKDKEIEKYEGIKIKRIFCRTDKTTKKIEKNKLMAKFKSIIYLWWLMKFVYKTKKYLKDKKYEILHCHDLIMAFCGCLFFNDKKIVFDMHEYYGDNKNKLKNTIIKMIVHYTQKKATWIIYVNEFQRQNCKKENIYKLIELPNFPDKKDFKTINKLNSSKIRISFIGKVRDEYSLKRLIDCDVDKELFDIKIYGDGSKYIHLLKYSKQMNKDYILQGEYNGVKDLIRIYSNTDIVFSVYDIKSSSGYNWKNAMPVKSYEAILTLTPIIASKDTVLGDFVKNKDIGFTIDIHKENDLKNLLSEILHNPNIIENKVKKLKKIQYLYVWENVVINLDKIYKK